MVNTKIFLAEIRSRLRVLFSQQKLDGLLTIESENKLASQDAVLINTPMAGRQRVYITDVLFNEYILR